MKAILNLLSVQESAPPTEDDLHRLFIAGEQVLSLCFSRDMFSRPAGSRPIAHYYTIQDTVLNTDVYALLMLQSDLEIDGASAAVLADSFVIFTGLLLHALEFTDVLCWFDATIRPLILAADEVYYSSVSGPQDSTKRSSKRSKALKKYIMASSILCMSKSQDVPESPALLALPAPASIDKSTTFALGTEQLVSGQSTAASGDILAETSPGLGISGMFSSVSGFLGREALDLLDTAFPNGVLALATEAPMAFVTGFLSGLRQDPQRGVKRKTIDLDDEGAAPAREIKIARPLPRPRHKCFPPSNYKPPRPPTLAPSLEKTFVKVANIPRPPLLAPSVHYPQPSDSSGFIFRSTLHSKIHMPLSTARPTSGIPSRSSVTLPPQSPIPYPFGDHLYI
ncbi:hypothetical protein C8R46DRAFT_1237128 [Mycena filopes]|nr:hypothetical protein C8R46DRAFT_1237128 [Mycena filopes]